ncbi:sigma-54 interaction domain-containing protein [Thermosulfuriphilus sp.]
MALDFIVGQSSAIQSIKELITQVVNTDLNVVIYGESGVGKELVARALHRLSYRKDKPFVKVNCAALPGELLESELFGHEKGAFTGAVTQKPGKFELANGGVIFLDEIGDMPLHLQAKLLQVLQDGEFSRVGGQKDIRVDTWVIAATNHDLDRDIKEGRFREDLYFRLNIIKIVVPPLRNRREDIPLLCKHFLARYSPRLGGQDVEIPTPLMELFMEYHWPGNVRELENYIRRFLVLKDWEPIAQDIRRHMDSAQGKKSPQVQATNLKDLVREELAPYGNGSIPLKEIRRKIFDYVERELIEVVLEKTNWNRRQAAEILQISYKALLYKMQNLGIKEPEKSSESG